MVNTSLIHRLNSNLPIKILGETSDNAVSYKEQILKSLQTGDILEGILVNKTESGYVLALKSGIHIPVFLLDEIDLGKLLQFKVESNNLGEIHLSLNKEVLKNLSQKVIEELNLEGTPGMEKCVKQFMAKELPLTKEALLNTHYLHKQYQIPSEAIVNVLAKSSQLTEKEARSLLAVKNNGIDNIVKEIKKHILEVPDVKAQLRILESLIKELPKDKKTITLEKMIEHILTQENPLNETQHNFTSKEVKKVWLDIMECLDAEGERTENNRLDIENLLKKNDVFYRERIKSFIEKIYDRTMAIDVKRSEEPLQRQLEELTKKILKVIEDGKLESLKDIGKDTVSTFKQSALALQKLNLQGDYFLFPFMNNISLNKGEIYFFEPKKQRAKGEKNTYIVIALDLTRLNHLEVHINKIKNKLSLNIIVETEDVKKHLTKYIGKLWDEIQAMGYQIEKCTYTLQGQKEHKAIASFIEHKITAFDTKV